MPWAPYWLRDGWLLPLYNTKWQCWGVMWRMQLRQMRLQRGTFWGKVLQYFSSFFHWQGRQPLQNYEAWLSTFRKAIEKEEYQPEHDDREEAPAFSLCSACHHWLPFSNVLANSWIGKIWQNGFVKKNLSMKNMLLRVQTPVVHNKLILQCLQAAPVKRTRLGLELALKMSISIVVLFGTD